MSETEEILKTIVRATQPWTHQAQMAQAATYGHIQRIVVDEVAELARGKAGDGYDLLSFAELLSPSGGEEEEVVDGRG